MVHPNLEFLGTPYLLSLWSCVLSARLWTLELYGLVEYCHSLWLCALGVGFVIYEVLGRCVLAVHYSHTALGLLFPCPTAILSELMVLTKSIVVGAPTA